MVCVVASSSASNRRRNSLTVSSISPAGAGVWSRSLGGGDGQEGVGEHGQGGPAVPGGPAADLVLVEPDQALGGSGRTPRCASVARRRATRVCSDTGRGV